MNTTTDIFKRALAALQAIDSDTTSTLAHGVLTKQLREIRTTSPKTFSLALNRFYDRQHLHAQTLVDGHKIDLVQD